MPPHPSVTGEPVQVCLGVGESGHSIPGSIPALLHGDPCVSLSYPLNNYSWKLVSPSLKLSGILPCLGPEFVLQEPLLPLAFTPSPCILLSPCNLGHPETDCPLCPLPPGYQHQVQPAAGGLDSHHGARGCHPNREEVVTSPSCSLAPGDLDPLGHTKQEKYKHIPQKGTLELTGS